MRYADRVTFVKTTDEQYNPDLGEYTHRGHKYHKTLFCDGHGHGKVRTDFWRLSKGS